MITKGGTNNVFGITVTEIEFTAENEIDDGTETGGMETDRSGIAIAIK
ncbi:MAG TPA: hypothetical protein VK274_03420 [Pyrinomonadaceae bacterium]|nr:hypothetical protein [Pyrinomonadaceae bacterium]